MFTYAILTNGVNTHAFGFNQWCCKITVLIKNEKSGGNKNH